MENRLAIANPSGSSARRDDGKTRGQGPPDDGCKRAFSGVSDRTFAPSSLGSSRHDILPASSDRAPRSTGGFRSRPRHIETGLGRKFGLSSFALAQASRFQAGTRAKRLPHAQRCLRCRASPRSLRHGSRPRPVQAYPDRPRSRCHRLGRQRRSSIQEKGETAAPPRQGR
jgi:hypothetical protein